MASLNTDTNMNTNFDINSNISNNEDIITLIMQDHRKILNLFLVNIKQMFYRNICTQCSIYVHLCSSINI